MNNWNSTISEWAVSNDRDPKIVEGILLRNGWKKEKYTNKMRGDLLDYLDKWYTLSVKELPTPATGLRKNPDFRLVTHLNSGWTILTKSNKKGNMFKTWALNKNLGLKLPSRISESRAIAFLNHDDYAEDLVA